MRICNIKEFDIYKNAFHFTIDKKETFKTYIGGFFGILNFLLILSLSFFYIKSFYIKSDPKIFEKRTNLNNHIIRNLNFHKFSVAWKLESMNGNYIETDGILFFNAYHQVWNKTKEGYIRTKNIPLKVIRCNESHTDYLEDRKDNDQWFCLDLEGKNISIGGKFHESNSTEILEINLSNCPTKNFDKNNCSKLENIKNLSSYVNFLHPSIEFNYDLDNPFIMGKKNLLSIIDPSISKTFICDYDYGVFSDDKGLINKAFVNKDYISLDNCMIDSNFIDDRQYQNQVVSLLTKLIYLSKIVIENKRSYMKIQDIVTVLNSSYNILNFMFFNIYYFILIFERKRFFIDKIWQENEKLDEMNKMKYNKKDKINIQNDRDENKSTRKFNVDQSCFIKKINLNILTKSEKEKSKKIKIVKKSKIDEIDYRNQSQFKDTMNNNEKYCNHSNNIILSSKKTNNQNIIDEVNHHKENKIPENFTINNDNIFSYSFSYLHNQIDIGNSSCEKIKYDLKLNYGFCKYTLKSFFKKKQIR